MFMRLISAVTDLHLNGNDDPLLQVFGQMVRQRVGVAVHPGQILRIQTDGDLSIGLQIAHVYGPIHQFVCDQIQIFVLVAVSGDQVDAILIDTLQSHHPVLLIHIDADLRIDLHIHRGIGLGFPGESDTQNQCQTGGGCSQGANPPVVFLLGWNPHGLHFRERLAHLISPVGNLQKSTRFIQYHRIAGVAFHNHIFQADTPPCFQI